MQVKNDTAPITSNGHTPQCGRSLAAAAARVRTRARTWQHINPAWTAAAAAAARRGCSCLEVMAPVNTSQQPDRDSAGVRRRGD